MVGNRVWYQVQAYARTPSSANLSSMVHVRLLTTTGTASSQEYTADVPPHAVFLVAVVVGHRGGCGRESGYTHGQHDIFQ